MGPIRHPLAVKLVTNWLIADPNLIHMDGEQTYRNYEAQKHSDLNVVYLFGGRWRTTKAVPRNVICFVLLVIAGVFFWIFEASWVWHNITPALVVIFSYLWFLAVMLFTKAATSDPGVLPRNVHLPSDNKALAAPEEYFTIITIPYFQRELDGVTVRYCTTCHVWRPARSSHCRSCNVCVADHDHHCIYINNCVGLRNQKTFLWCLLCSCTSLTIEIVCSFVQVFHYRIVESAEVTTFAKSIAKYPLVFFLAIYTSLLLVYPGLILILHILLTSQNLTTREFLNRNTHDKPFVNVYNTRSILKNLYINWIGKSRGVSSIRLKDTYTPGDFRMEDVSPFE